MPSQAKKASEAGSPACSPQMPISRLGLAARAALDGHADQFADALLVDGHEGIDVVEALALDRRRGRPARRRARCRRWSGSGRWCRRKRNRHGGRCRRRAARRAAVRSWCRRRTLTPRSAQNALAFDDGIDLVAHPRHLARRGDERHHDLERHGLGPPAAAGFPEAGDKGADLHLEDFGIGDGEPHSRDGPSIGLISARRSSRSRSARTSSPSEAAVSSISSSVRGRNSCSGGSNSRTVTGRPGHDREQRRVVAGLEVDEAVEGRRSGRPRFRRGSCGAAPPCARARRTCARNGPGRCPRRRS